MAKEKSGFGRRVLIAAKAVMGTLKPADVSPILRQYFLNWNSQTPTNVSADLTSFAEKGYAGNAYVHSIVNQISLKCAAIPWVLYRVVPAKAAKFKRYKILSHSGYKKFSGEVRELKAETLEEVTDHPLNDILHKPNPLMPFPEFIEAVVGFKLVMGNSFVFGVPPQTGDDANSRRWLQIYPFRADKVTIVGPEYPLPILGYVVGDRQTKFPPEVMLHIKRWNPLNPRIGLSPLEACFEATRANIAMNEWNYSVTKNMGRLSGVLSVNVDEMTPVMREQIRSEFMARQAGAQNAGVPLITNAEIDFKEMAINPKDMDWAKGLQMTANQIALAFNWPPELVGDAAQKTRANLREMVSYAYYGTVLPEMDSLRDHLNDFLIDPWNEIERVPLYLDYNVEDIEALQEDRQGVFIRTINAYKSGLLTKNQALLAIGYEAVGPEGDEYAPVQQGGMLPWGNAAGNSQEEGKMFDELIAHDVDDYGLLVRRNGN